MDFKKLCLKVTVEINFAYDIFSVCCIQLCFYNAVGRGEQSSHEM